MIVGIRGLRIYVGPWALGLIWGRLVVRVQINSNENVRLKIPSTSYEWEGWGSRPNRSIFSAKQSRDQKVCSVIQNDIPGNSIDKDMYYEHTGQMGAEKYLRESCYHHIECSVANSLAMLIRKWYLNSCFQPYSYSPKTSGRCWCDKD